MIINIGKNDIRISYIYIDNNGKKTNTKYQ